jgi:predicted alpha/beta-hydrolase family hydrolase
MSKLNSQQITIRAHAGQVSGLWLEPQSPQCALVFAHGAGANMRHTFMEVVAQQLAAENVATLRFNFPYMEYRKRSPDPKPVLISTIRAALTEARGLTNVPVLAGGKSLGGRMASWAVAEGEDVRALVFFGFPLHAPGKVSTERAEHLNAVKVPMLFLQGTRDTLADLDSIRRVCHSLGKRATLQVIEGGDHSFKLPASMHVSQDEVLRDLATRVGAWARGVLGVGG